MAVDVERRITHWNKKFNTYRVEATLEDSRARMAANFASATARLCEMELKVKEVLNLSKVHTIMYVPYLDFARQLYKLSCKRGVSGDSFALAADVLLKHWAGRGLNPVVLARIRTQVFDIGEPAP